MTPSLLLASHTNLGAPLPPLPASVQSRSLPEPTLLAADTLTWFLWPCSSHWAHTLLVQSWGFSSHVLASHTNLGAPLPPLPASVQSRSLPANTACTPSPGSFGHAQPTHCWCNPVSSHARGPPPSSPCYPTLLAADTLTWFLWPCSSHWAHTLLVQPWGFSSHVLASHTNLGAPLPPLPASVQSRSLPDPTLLAADTLTWFLWPCSCQ